MNVKWNIPKYNIINKSAKYISLNNYFNNMILINSCFVTEDRDVSLNRFCRFDIYKYMLKSISKITFSHVYFFIKLDDEFNARKDELVEYINSLFKKSEIHIEFNRFEYQHEWIPFIHHYLCNKFSSDELVYFIQTDDHIFVDEDEKHLQEGLELMKQDQHPFKTLYLSHWPEILKLSGKESLQNKIGNYIVFPCTNVDSIQVFTLAFLRYIICDIPWNGRCIKRIDLITRYYLLDNPTTTLRLHNIYVPLKELCRKFNAYGHVNMPFNCCPQLVLPEDDNKEILKMNIEKLSRLVNAPHHSGWSYNNKFVVPKDWMTTILKLYNL